MTFGYYVSAYLACVIISVRCMVMSWIFTIDIVSFIYGFGIYVWPRVRSTFSVMMINCYANLCLVALPFSVLCGYIYDILGPYTPAVGQPCPLDLGSMQAQLRLLWVSDCDRGSFLYSGVLFYRSLCPCLPVFVSLPMVCGGHFWGVLPWGFPSCCMLVGPLGPSFVQCCSCWGLGPRWMSYAD